MTEYVEDYIAYLREWALTRNRKNFAQPVSFERFARECREEDGEDYTTHMRFETRMERFV